MPIEKPIKMGPNSYYFHGELWTAEEISERFGPTLLPTHKTTEEKSETCQPAFTSA